MYECIIHMNKYHAVVQRVAVDVAPVEPAAVVARHLSIYLSVYIYIYIERERDR